MGVVRRRLDLAGPLMGGLFRGLFKKFTKEVKNHLQKSLNDGEDFKIASSVRPKLLSDGERVGGVSGIVNDWVNG